MPQKLCYAANKCCCYGTESCIENQRKTKTKIQKTKKLFEKSKATAIVLDFRCLSTYSFIVQDILDFFLNN